MQPDEIEQWLRFAKGDTPGHDFHGNQYQQGEAGASRESDPGRFQTPGDRNVASAPLQSFQITPANRIPGEAEQAGYTKWISEHASAVYDPFDATHSEATPLARIGSRIFPTQTKNLTAEQGAAVNDYTIIGSKVVNGSLRGQRPDSPYADRLAENLSNAIHSGTIDQPMTVFRAISSGVLDNYKPGDTFTDKGFVSTSAFSGAATRFGQPITAQISLPAGIHALGVADCPKTGLREGEILLDSGSQFRIDSVTQDPVGSSTYNMTYIGDADNQVAKSAALPNSTTRFIWFPGDIVASVAKGDTPGHEFHGNQYAEGDANGKIVANQFSPSAPPIQWSSPGGPAHMAAHLAWIRAGANGDSPTTKTLIAEDQGEKAIALSRGGDNYVAAHYPNTAAEHYNAAWKFTANPQGDSDSFLQDAADLHSAAAANGQPSTYNKADDAVSEQLVSKDGQPGHAFNGNQYVSQGNGHTMIARDHANKAGRFPGGSKLSVAHIEASHAQLRAANAASDAANGEPGAAEKYAERADEARVASARANLLTAALVSKSSTSMVDYDDQYTGFETKNPPNWGYLDDAKNRLKVRLVPHVAPEDLELNNPDRDPANQLPVQHDAAVVEVDI